MNLLFVCTGNSCRSVMAHFLAQKLLEDRGRDWNVKSAGIVAKPYFPIPQEVRNVLERRDVPPFHHLPTPLKPEMVDWADSILVMERAHLDFLKAEYPELESKTSLLLEKAGLGDHEVADPIGQGEDVYEKTLSVIEKAVEKILDDDRSA